MYDGPQVQNKRRKNASYRDHIRTELGYCCPCGKTIGSKSSLYRHLSLGCEPYRHAEKEFKKANEEYHNGEVAKVAIASGKIKCSLCDFWGHNLVTHLRLAHGVEKGEYDGPTLSPLARQRYSEQNKHNGNWIERKKAAGESLDDYREKLAKATKEAILNSPAELARRSALAKNTIARWAQTEEGRASASRTAKKTSMRPEVQEARAERLHQWRLREPERFQKECVDKFLAAPKKWKKTKPEKFLEAWLEEEYKDAFEYGKMLRSKKYEEINKSGRKQIDFRSKDRKILIEVDGVFHFPKLGNQDRELKHPSILEGIEKAIKKDKITEEIARSRSKVLIRVGFSCWASSTGRIKQKVLDKIREIIDNKQIGIHKLGEEYGEDNCL